MGVFPSDTGLLPLCDCNMMKEVFNKANIQTVYWYDDTGIAALGGKRGLYMPGIRQVFSALVTECL